MKTYLMYDLNDPTKLKVERRTQSRNAIAEVPTTIDEEDWPYLGFEKVEAEDDFETETIRVFVDQTIKQASIRDAASRADQEQARIEAEAVKRGELKEITDRPTLTLPQATEAIKKIIEHLKL